MVVVTCYVTKNGKTEMVTHKTLVKFGYNLASWIPNPIAEC